MSKGILKRSPGRPLIGKDKRIRTSFTLAPDKLAWLKAYSRSAGRSRSETLEEAIGYMERLYQKSTNPLVGLCARYPSIFWDIDVSDLESNQHSEFVIERILEHGSMASVHDLFLTFPIERIAQVVKTSRRISPKTGRFWGVRLNIKEGIRCLKEESQSKLSELWRH